MLLTVIHHWQQGGVLKEQLVDKFFEYQTSGINLVSIALVTGVIEPPRLTIPNYTDDLRGSQITGALLSV